MDVICINDVFKPEIMAFFLSNGITTPKKGKVYSIRQIIPSSLLEKTDKGILLNEIHNNPIPIKHPVLGVIRIEPNWSIKRFATLTNEPVSEKEVLEETV